MPLHKINDQWIHYEDTGENLPPVVLTHGLLLDCQMFAPQLEALRSTYRIVTWDARCHGETESTDELFSYWDLAEDLGGLLDHLGIARAVVGGMGQGGSVALRFALNNPQRVAGLFLIATEAGSADPEKVPTYESISEMWATDGLNDELAERIAAIVLGNDWSGRNAWIDKWRQWPTSLLRPAFNALLGRDDIHDRLGEIKAPAVVVHGTSDDAIDIGLAELLCSRLANCRPLIRIEGGGHACNLTHPKLVNLAAQQHLGEFGLLTPPGLERRRDRRRGDGMRRRGERRDLAGANAGRRALHPPDRRMAERRGRERHTSSPPNNHTAPSPK